MLVMGKKDGLKTYVWIPPQHSARSTILIFTTLIYPILSLAELDLEQSCFSLTPLQSLLHYTL